MSRGGGSREATYKAASHEEPDRAPGQLAGGDCGAPALEGGEIGHETISARSFPLAKAVDPIFIRASPRNVLGFPLCRGTSG